MRALLIAMAMLFSLQMMPATSEYRDREMSVVALQERQPAQEPAPAPDARVDIDIRRESGSPWYANPMWIAIGAVGAVVLILLIVLAARGGGTTVVRS